MSLADDKNRFRASSINNHNTNPWLREGWSKKALLEKSKTIPKTIYEPWIKSIQHLQAFAWRYHKKGCVDPSCLGCDTGLPLPDVDLKLYFHQKQAEYLTLDPACEGWAITGRRFGKTEVMIFYIICRLLGYNPLTAELYNTPQRWWIVGLDYPMLRDGVIYTFKKIMPDISAKWHGDINAWDFKKGDLIAEIPWNGGQAIFKSCESGESKFQSVEVDGIGFDEEPMFEIYNESKLRIGGGKTLTIRGTMTPDRKKGLTWTYKKILKNEQRINEGKLKVWTGSSYDNKAISKAYLDDLCSEYEDWEKKVYIDGEYVIGMGRCVFNVDSIYKLKDAAVGPLYTENISGGILSVWEEPKEGTTYIVGADPAEGLAHGDNSSATILRRDTDRLKMVCSYVGIIDPDTFGAELVSLALWYNSAWVICESNNHGLTTITTMQKKGFVNLYAGKSLEDLAGVSESRKMGWHTNAISRQTLVDAMCSVVREKNIDIPDDQTIDEMSTFIIDKKGKAQAQAGVKDDRVFSLGLAIQGHIRCPLEVVYLPTEAVKKTYSIFDDPREDNKKAELAWMGV